MTILQGHFAILLVVKAPDAISASDLEAALDDAAKRFDLVIAVKPLSDPDDGEGEGEGEESESLTISVHGADRPGIVKAVAGVLAEKGGNVVDLSTQLIGAPERPVYVLTLRALVEGGTSEDVEAAVTDTARELGVSCTVRRDDADLF